MKAREAGSGAFEIGIGPLLEAFVTFRIASFLCLSCFGGLLLSDLQSFRNGEAIQPLSDCGAFGSFLEAPRLACALQCRARRFPRTTKSPVCTTSCGRTGICRPRSGTR